MMKYAFLWFISILAFVSVAEAQFAIIKDPDGFTNVRDSSSIKAKIVGKFHDGDVFTYTYEKNGWVTVYFFPTDTSDAGYFKGFLRADRLQPVENLPHIPKEGKTLVREHLKLQNDSMTVELIRAPFQPKQHAFKKDKHGLVEKIDGRKPNGTDGDVPHETLTRLRMSVYGKEVKIPATAWNDLYDPTLETCNIFFDTKTGFIYLIIPASGAGAGAYQIAWVFKDGQYIKRYIDGF